MKSTILFCFVLVLGLSFLHKEFLNSSCSVSGIQCYQCSINSDPDGSDNCGAYGKFDKDRHVLVECTSDESHTPGTFCVKVIKQGPRGFITDGRWRNVIRRCGLVSDRYWCDWCMQLGS